MTVHYEELAVPVDPEFARELKAHLDARRVHRHGPPKPSPTGHQSTQLPPITEVTLVLTPVKQPDHRGRRAGLVAAAVVAVLAAGSVLVLATSDDDSGQRPAAMLPPESSAPATVTSPLTPEAQEAIGLAQRFMEASDAWDGEAVRALVTDDAVIDDFAVTNADDYLLVAEFEEATGWRYMQPECTATVPDPPVKVTCTYTMENAWSQAIGVGPFTGSTFEFVIADGQIQQITHDFDFSDFDPEVLAVFDEWLTVTYPNDFDVMWDSGAARLTPEAIALFKQHTTEFVSSRSSPGSG